MKKSICALFIALVSSVPAFAGLKTVTCTLNSSANQAANPTVFQIPASEQLWTSLSVPSNLKDASYNVLTYFSEHGQAIGLQLIRHKASDYIATGVGMVSLSSRDKVVGDAPETEQVMCSLKE